jgi:hypothetical protein
MKIIFLKVRENLKNLLNKIKNAKEDINSRIH